jgi:hypothetical protein
MARPATDIKPITEGESGDVRPRGAARDSSLSMADTGTVPAPLQGTGADIIEKSYRQRTLPRTASEPSLIAKEETVVEESMDKELDYEDRAQEIGLRERIEFLDFRKEWSRRLLTLVVFIVLFNAVFLVLIGRDILQFRDEWLVRIIFAGSFIEVLGLAKLVVEFLFKIPPDERVRPRA